MYDMRAWVYEGLLPPNPVLNYIILFWILFFFTTLELCYARMEFGYARMELCYA